MMNKAPEGNNEAVTIKRYYNKIIILLIFPCIVIISLSIGGMYYFYQFCITAASSNAKAKPIVIKKGESLKYIALNLAKADIITHPRLFIYLSILKHLGSKIKAGEYSLSKAMTPLQILDIITSGKSILYPVTIKEGSTIKDIIELLSNKQLIDRERFISIIKDKEVIRSLGIEADSLEGYIFPDTYYFSKDTGEVLILKTMVSNFHRVFNKQRKIRVKELGLSVHDIVTLASMIEKETSLEKEKSLISAVFYNRLKKNMKLQSDPTVIFALKNFSGNIRKEDLMVNSPYNTYINYGIPPGPIGSPGEASISAALYPEDAPYYYFVSKNDGSHEFSITSKEHEKAVRRYQLN